jgi:hypothetical protein
MIRTFITVVLLAVAVAHPVEAQQSAKVPFWRNHISRDDRIALANEIRSELKIDVYFEKIPRLSPTERRWLNNEMQGGENRWLAALKSREYSIQQALFFVESIKGMLDEIVTRSPKSEFATWTVLAYTLVDDDSEYVNAICKGNVIDKCPHDGDFATLENFARMYGKKIILGVIGPKFGTGFSN